MENLPQWAATSHFNAINVTALASIHEKNGSGKMFVRNFVFFLVQSFSSLTWERTACANLFAEGCSFHAEMGGTPLHYI